MNLEQTTDIIFLHKMATDMEAQVIGRALRYGRTDAALHIWYLFNHEEM